MTARSAALGMRGVVAMMAAVAVAGFSDRLANASERDREPDQTADPAHEAPVSAPRGTAQALFEVGQMHYSLGEYDQAIARFRQAYGLFPAPALLFNIAQAHRLKGDCEMALEIYRHFARLAPDSTQAGEAGVRIQELEARCPSPGVRLSAPAAQRPAPASVAPVRAAMASTTVAAKPRASLPRKSDSPADASPGSTRIRLARAFLVGGVTVAAAAGVLYWWNDSRYQRWSAEDRQLSTASGTSTDRSVWIARQNGNDTLLRSIQHVDTATGVLFAVAGIGILGSATLGILPSRGAQIAVAPGEIRVAWGLRWR